METKTFLFKVPEQLLYSPRIPEHIIRVDIIDNGEGWYWSYHGTYQVEKIELKEAEKVIHYSAIDFNTAVYYLSKQQKWEYVD